MNVRHIFVLLSTRTKKRFLLGLLKGHIRTINPETLDYEEEEGVLNCFGSMEQAKRVRKALGKEKQVSVLAFSIPEECIEPRVIDRKGHSKVHTADCVERQFGVRNYLAAFGCGEEESRYLVLADMACLMEAFDPEEKGRQEQPAVKPAVEEKKPEPAIKETVQEAFKDVCPQRETGTGTPEWLVPSVWGMLLGFIAGTAFARAVQEHPVMATAALPVIAAVLITAWMYRHSDGTG